MDCLVNSTTTTSTNWTEGGGAASAAALDFSFNATDVLPWLVSRLRIFLYLSDPREESFQHVHEVADYHTEVRAKSMLTEKKTSESDFEWRSRERPNGEPELESRQEKKNKWKMENRFRCVIGDPIAAKGKPSS